MEIVHCCCCCCHKAGRAGLGFLLSLVLVIGLVARYRAEITSGVGVVTSILTTTVAIAAGVIVGGVIAAGMWVLFTRRRDDAREVEVRAELGLPAIPGQSAPPSVAGRPVRPALEQAAPIRVACTVEREQARS